MFTVKTKSKIPRTESYPLKASEVSEALSRVAQAKLLEIRFWRYVRTQDRDRKVWPLVALTYSRVRVGISTSNDWIAEGWLGPSWQLTISPLPRTMRHAINSLLVGEALPKLKVWLEARKDLHGKFGHDGIHVSFDQESEQLRYE
jgi:hypothetical protein